MAAVTRRQYKGAAASTTTTNSLTSVDTSVTLTATTGWPSTAAVPFYVVIDPGNSSEEKCSATISGSTLTLTRGQDDTTAVSHNSGATIYPVFSADEADEANNMAATMTTKGDLLVTTGSAFNRLAVGTNAHVLTADSTATNGVKWAVVGDVITSSANTFTTNQIITGSSASALLRVTQTGAGDAFVVEDEANPDATSFAITAIGDVQIGTANDLGKVNIGGTLALHSASPLLNFVDVSNTRIGYLNHDATNIILLNQVAGYVSFGTNNTERMRIDSAGNIGIGAASLTNVGLRLGKQITGSSTSYGMFNAGTIQSDVTAAAYSHYSGLSTQATAFTLTNLVHYAAVQGTIGAGSTVTEQNGFYVATTMTGATTNVGFRGLLAAAANNYNIYMGGTAANYLAGRLGVGATLTSGAMAQVTNTAAADKALVVKGAASQTGNFFEIQNSAGTSQMSFDSNGLIAGAGTSLGAWTSYTPTLSGTGWALGDGTLTGSYCQIGKIVHFRLFLSFGSTSTFGASADLLITLPLAMTGNAQSIASFKTAFRDASASQVYEGTTLAGSSTTVVPAQIGTIGALTAIRSTVPFTWATSDYIRVHGTYET